MKRGILRRLDALASDGVERADPCGPPTAFRIWKAGDNVTDHGPTIFSERSARLLLEQQATRENRFPIDIDHLSLDKEAPIHLRVAVGWFSIDVRDGELWAVDVEWTDVVRAGLAKDPPEWKYHSPAYDLDVETNEVVSLLNLALTNVPATHGVTALASRGASHRKDSSRMKLEDIKAAFEGADEEKKAAAWSAIAKAMASSAGDSEEAEKKEDSADDGEGKSSKTASEDEPEKKDAKATDDEPEKKDSKMDSAVAKILAEQDAKIRKLEADAAASRKAKEGEERKSLIASKEMTPALAKSLASQPLETVRSICAALPNKTVRAAVVTPETAGAVGTRGEGQGDGTASRLPEEERKALDERMGLRPVAASIKHEGVHQIFPTMTPAEARRHLDAKKASAAKESK